MINGFKIMAIKILDMVAILDFSKMVKIIKMAFEHLHIALAVKLELRFTLRSTVSETIAIEVLFVSAILDFSKHLKMAQNGIWAIAYCPLGLELHFAL